MDILKNIYYDAIIVRQTSPLMRATYWRTKLEIIVKIFVESGVAGIYKLHIINNEYRWCYVLFKDRDKLSGQYLSLHKTVRERCDNKTGYYFEFEEGDLESLR